MPDKPTTAAGYRREHVEPSLLPCFYRISRDARGDAPSYTAGMTHSPIIDCDGLGASLRMPPRAKTRQGRSSGAVE